MADRQSWIVAGEAFNMTVYGEKYDQFDQVGSTQYTVHSLALHALNTNTFPKTQPSPPLPPSLLPSCLNHMKLACLWKLLACKIFNHDCPALEGIKMRPSQPL